MYLQYYYYCQIPFVEIPKHMYRAILHCPAHLQLSHFPPISLQPFLFPCSRSSNHVFFSILQEMIREVQAPDFYLPPPLYLEHPSHLHIDLLPRAQGKGMGTAMIKTILALLKAKGNLNM